MKALPLTAEMALAAILGHKTETRRPLNQQPKAGSRFVIWKPPFGPVGTELWMREPGRIAELAYSDESVQLLTIEYLADKARRVVALPDRLGVEDLGRDPSWLKMGHGIPNGIFREAARFKTVALDVRVERLQEITRESIRAEGFTLPPSPRFTPGKFSELHQGFAHTWDRIYSKRPGLAWADNPWVSVTKFKPMEAI